MASDTALIGSQDNATTAAGLETAVIPRHYLNATGKQAIAARAAKLRSYLLIRRMMRAAKGQ